MQKIMLPILAILVIGIVFISLYSDGKLKEIKGQNVPTPTPKITKTLKQNKILENIKKSLYQDGVQISVQVEQVYPGLGFIGKDASGRIFIKSKSSVVKGQNLTVEGMLKKTSEQIESLKKNSSYDSELDNFLKEQKIIIEAKEVKAS